MSAAINIYEEPIMGAPLNDSERTLWALGWYLKRERLSGRFEENSLKAFGKAIGMTHTGYQNLEKGESPNLRAWYDICNYIGKRFSRVLLLAESIAVDIATEEELRGRQLTTAERERIALQLHDTFTRL